MSIEVRILEPHDHAAWDEFVKAQPQASPFHLTAWKFCIEETFRYKPMYLLAVQGKDIVGVLPLFLVNGFVIGRALISTPFAVYGGILASSAAGHAALSERTYSLARELNVQYVDLRNGYIEQCISPPNVHRYSTFTKLVSPDEAELMESLPKKTRNMVRKTGRTPFTTRTQYEDISSFERLHSENMRRLGTPSFPKRHFRTILENFRGLVDIREVLLEGTIVAASLNFYFLGQMHTYYAASDPSCNALAPNTYMYFDHLRWAGQNGFSLFEFGRSKKETGPYEFKRHWGTQIRDLPYNVLLIREKEVPNYTPANKKFHGAINIWKKLPLPITRVLGPQLIRMFP